MQKLLIYCAISASLLITGCGTVKEWGHTVGDAMPSMPAMPSIPGMPDRIPLMHHQNIQQGNIVSQELIDQLRPGMARRQVKYIMGTPILVDVFHQDRWDYVYSMKEGNNPRSQKRISLFFSDDKLIRIEGDFRPQPINLDQTPPKEIIFTVPDYEQKNKGFFTRTLEKIGLSDD